MLECTQNQKGCDINIGMWICKIREKIWSKFFGNVFLAAFHDLSNIIIFIRPRLFILPTEKIEVNYISLLILQLHKYPARIDRLIFHRRLTNFVHKCLPNQSEKQLSILLFVIHTLFLNLIINAANDFIWVFVKCFEYS